MPFAGLGLHLLVAVFFAVHALRSGQNMYWLIILFSFPLLGSIAASRTTVRSPLHCCLPNPTPPPAGNRHTRELNQALLARLDAAYSLARKD